MTDGNIYNNGVWLGRNNDGKSNNLKNILGPGARPATVREYVKLLSRLASALTLEPGNNVYLTENQRLVCAVETNDVFAASCPDAWRKREFVARIVAPVWGLTADGAVRYVEGRMPHASSVSPMDMGDDGYGGKQVVTIGRAKLLLAQQPRRGGEEDDSSTDDAIVPGRRRNFAETSHSLRFMESIAVCASQNEPALLVGETGCGKTTLVQRVASMTNRTLLVQNLSLQTDSTDLLGGYRPLEMKHVARNIYTTFVDLFVSSFSRTQNATFFEVCAECVRGGKVEEVGQVFCQGCWDGGEQDARTAKGQQGSSQPRSLGGLSHPR